MIEEEVLLKIKELLHHRENNEEIKALLTEYHPYDIAQMLGELNDSERQELYEILEEEDLADILSYIDEDEAAEYIQEMSYTQGADVLTEMDPDDAADILNEIEEDSDVSTYLEQMEPEAAEEVKYLQSHEEGSAGAIMSTDFIKIESGTDVKDATKILGYEANETEVIDPLFVCKGDELIGVLKLQDLITARTPKKVDEIMDTAFIYGEVTEDAIEVAKKIKYYSIFALPILDQGRLVGIVTMDDALDVATESISEDYAKMAAVSSEEPDSSVLKNILKRVPWLMLLLFISLLISNVTAKFEDIISSVTVLWFFNTMILDMAGNAGTQTLAVAVRHLGRNELNGFKRSASYVLRELLVTFINSLILGVFSFAISFLFIKILHYDESINIVPTCLVISSSLSITLVLTGILGSIVPILMNKVKIDPATASGPVITTINDILALVVYFGLASAFLDKIMK